MCNTCTLLHKCLPNENTIPELLPALMRNTIMSRTSTAVSKMLRAAETIITEIMLPLSSLGFWVTVYKCIFVVPFSLECSFKNEDAVLQQTYLALWSIL